jgi:hypothetical protein
VITIFLIYYKLFQFNLPYEISIKAIMPENLESDTNFNQILEFDGGDFLCKIMGESNAWDYGKKGSNRGAC